MKSSISAVIRGLKSDIWKDLEKESTLSSADRFIANPALLMDAIEVEKRQEKGRRLEYSMGAFLEAINYLRKFDGLTIVRLISDGFPVKRGDPFKPPDPSTFSGKRKLKILTGSWRSS